LLKQVGSGAAHRAGATLLQHSQVISREDKMDNQMKELQVFKGIGKVLSQRLVDSGYTSVARIAAAQPRAMERIEGLSSMKTRIIIAQARKMVGTADKQHHSWPQESDIKRFNFIKP
jgi:predicted flap endonuclease-1-like 5' DNA nuclease